MNIVGSIMDLGYNEGTALALADELQRGYRFNKATVAARERAAAQEAEALRASRTLKGLGKPVLALDQQQYEELVEKYGYDAFGDRGFIRDMQRHCPENKIFNA